MVDARLQKFLLIGGAVATVVLLGPYFGINIIGTAPDPEHEIEVAPVRSLPTKADKPVQQLSREKDRSRDEPLDEIEKLLE